MFLSKNSKNKWWFHTRNKTTWFHIGRRWAFISPYSWTFFNNQTRRLDKPLFRDLLDKTWAYLHTLAMWVRRDANSIKNFRHRSDLQLKAVYIYIECKLNAVSLKGRTFHHLSPFHHLQSWYGGLDFNKFRSTIPSVPAQYKKLKSFPSEPAEWIESNCANNSKYTMASEHNQFFSKTFCNYLFRVLFRI